MKIIFLDIDGVLNNRGCHRPGNVNSKYGRNPDPECVAALNRITAATGAKIVISSTWRISGLEHMRETLAHWGVSADVIDVTPRLETFRGDITMSAPRGREIQAWLNRNKIDSFIILDDDADMEHLTDKLILTDFQDGLTPWHVLQAVKMLGDHD